MRGSLVFILLAACQSRTELLVGVATDIKAPTTVDYVQLSVTDSKTGVQVQQASWPITGVPQMPYNLPGSYGIYSDGNEAQLDIELVGMKGNTPVVTRHSLVSLVEGQTLFYRIGLTAACVGRDDCPQGESCVEGSCRDVKVDSLQLPTYDDSLVTHVSCTSGAQYIDTGTGLVMPPTTDADKCPLSQCLEGTCLLPPPDTGSRDITGSEIAGYIDHGQVVFAPDDLSTADFAALVPDGSGGVITIPGHGTAQGQYVIPAVPNGKYFLKYNSQYFYTDASSIDLGYSVFGRQGRQVPASTTSITVSATGLDPWSQADALEAQSMGAVSYWGNLDDDIPITDGATTLSNYTIDSNLAYAFHLIANDDFEMYQMRSKMTAQGVQYFSPSTMLVATPFTQADGSNTVVNGTFQALAQDQTLSVMFPSSQWESLVGFDGTNAVALNPLAHRIAGQFPAPSFAIYAQTAGLQYGQGGSPAMYNLFLPALPGSDSTVGMMYASPAIPNQTLSEYYQVGDNWAVDYMLPGTSTPTRVYASLTSSDTLAALNGALAPGLGPVVAPTINGHDLFTEQVGVGPTPTIAWTAPAVGKPGQYSVGILELTANGTTTNPKFIASFITPEASIQIPPDILVPGHTYVIDIFCETTSHDAPFRWRFPYANSDVLSAIITI